MQDTGHLFLSYRSIEADFALKLAADLRNSGIRIWMDRLDIKTGQNWSNSIRDALDSCSGLIAILSPDYFNSQYCPNELTRAYSAGKTIFPLVLRPVPKEMMPIELELTQHIDFASWQDNTFYSSKFQALIETIKEKAAHQVGDIPDLERQYLNKLISELERRAGVLQYIELDTAWVGLTPERPSPRSHHIWEPEFALLKATNENNETDVILSNIHDAVRNNPSFVLIGEPGTGKTTTIHKLALDAARRKLEDRTAPIPLVLYLSSWSNKVSIIEFISTIWAFQPDRLGKYLETGEIHLYLDGLNEMGADGAEKAAQLKEWLHSKQKPKNVIVTCRRADYVSELNLDLPTVTCQELSEERIRQFAKQYLDSEKAEIFLKNIIPSNGKEQEDKRHIYSLAKNPYLLAALIYIFEHSSSSELPRNSGALFKQMAMTLWQREYRRKTPGWVEFTDMESSFAKLAYAMTNGNKPTDVSIEWALRNLAGIFFYIFRRKENLQLLYAGRSANIIDTRGENNNVRFYHQLMQEYFSAAGLQKSNIKGKLNKPTFTNRRRQAQKWDQVIIALCGITDDPDNLVLDIAMIDPFLSASCILSGIKITNETNKFVTELLLKEWRKGDTDIQAVVVDTLATLGANVAELIISEQSSFTKNQIPKKRKNDCKVFLSYRRSASMSGSGLVLLVADRLRKEGIDVFLDVESISSGSFFPTIIEKEIINSTVFIPILAPSTLESEWVRREIQMAINHNKIIIPILEQGFHFSTQELTQEIKVLEQFNSIILINEYFDAGMEKLISHIKEVCK